MCSDPLPIRIIFTAQGAYKSKNATRHATIIIMMKHFFCCAISRKKCKLLERIQYKL